MGQWPAVISTSAQTLGKSWPLECKYTQSNQCNKVYHKVCTYRYTPLTVEDACKQTLALGPVLSAVSYKIHTYMNIARYTRWELQQSYLISWNYEEIGNWLPVCGPSVMPCHNYEHKYITVEPRISEPHGTQVCLNMEMWNNTFWMILFPISCTVK